MFELRDSTIYIDPVKMLENVFCSKSTVDVSIVIIFNLAVTLWIFNERKVTLESLIEEGTAINKKL